MSASLEQLIAVRSQLVEEVLAYLDAVARRAAELPAYYPTHLRPEAGETRFDAIRQRVQVVEDRSAFERWLAEERERQRAAGQEVERLAYAPRRASLEAEEKGREVRRVERPAPPPPIPWDEQAGERFKRAVILGDPGFGKTWLLRYEARRLALKAHKALDGQTVSPDNLIIPIFVRLSELNQSDDAIEEALVRLAAARLQQSPRFKESGKRLGGGQSLQAFHHFMREKLDKEQCVVLLDSWDEIPLEQPKEGHIVYEPHRRQRLGQRLEAFARYYPNLHILLTSRIVGYGASPIPQAQELELLAFDEVQVESFASVWFGSDTDTAAQFLALLRQNPQVQGLGRIPLMLALMCRAYQERRLAFPTRRVDLYNRCLRGLLRDWKEEKQQRRISDLQLERTLQRLAHGAFRLRLERSEQFSELLLAEALGFNLKRDTEAKRAEKFIESLKHDGILITAGEHRDAPLLFLHRTFHEYLTACALAQQANCEGWWAIAGFIDKKTWLPEWQEVIVLLAGQLRGPRPLLKMLSNPRRTRTNPRGDDYFRHRLALAALCLPEIPPEIRSLGSSFVDRITTAAFSLWWEWKINVIEAAVPHLTRALPALGQVNGRMESTPLLEWLSELLSDTDWKVRAAAAKAVGRLGVAATPEILGHLSALLSDEDWRVQRAAAEAVGRLGVAAATPKILGRLSVLLGDMDWVVRVAAEKAVGEFGAAAIPDLLGRLSALLHGKGIWVRRAAAKAVGRLGAAATPEILGHLHELLGNADKWVQAAEAVRMLGAAAATPAILGRLSVLLGDGDREVRERAAAEAVGWLGAAAATPEIVDRLSALLSDEDWRVQRAAAEAVGRLGAAAATPEIVDRLSALLSDWMNWWVRQAAAEAVGRLGAAAATPEILDRLSALLCHWHPGLREVAAEAVGNLGAAAATPEFLDRLIELLHHEGELLHYEDWEVRGVAAEAVGRLLAQGVRIFEVESGKWEARTVTELSR